MSPIRNGVRSILSKQVERKIIVRAPPVEKDGLAIRNIIMFLGGCFTVYEVVRRKRELRRIREAYMREEE